MIPMARVFAQLDPKQFEACFLQWVHSLSETISGVIAIDGKTVLATSAIRSQKRPLKSAKVVVKAALCNRISHVASTGVHIVDRQFPRRRMELRS
jgi:hypothetical protein